MTRINRYRMAPQTGVTLVEMLVSVALGLAILLAMSAAYVGAKQSLRFQDTAGRLQEDANFALDLLSHDLRMAGFAGCRGIDAVTVSGPPSVTTYYPTSGLATQPSAITGPNPLATVVPTDTVVTAQPLDIANFVRGFDGVPSTMFSSGNVPTTNANDSSIYVAMASANAVSVSAAMASTTSPLSISSDPFGWYAKHGSSGSMYFVVSDCKISAIFSGKVNSAGNQVAHDTTLGNAANSFPAGESYGTDAIIAPLEWYFYYVATRSGASTPSLYRIAFDGFNRGTAEEVVANVEGLRVHYGENTMGVDSVTNNPCTIATGGVTCVPTMRVDAWRTSAASVTDWSRVVAVRVGLMMVSDDQNAKNDITAATPPLLGASYSLPSGASTNRLRKEFSTTIVLRNRVAPF